MYQTIVGGSIVSTPHARGSTARCRAGAARTWVYPACAGIHPYSPPLTPKRESLPRMRGDPPCEGGTEHEVLASTPHARGSTLVSISYRGEENVYPACAGIHLAPTVARVGAESLPRMRGDPPVVRVRIGRLSWSTPHARGSTVSVRIPKIPLLVYPACAGIHPTEASSSGAPPCLPRMRGDPPRKAAAQAKKAESTPHARGSTRGASTYREVVVVYPACAGIHLILELTSRRKFGLPRMRGDPPFPFGFQKFLCSSTPHARGST